MRRIRVSISTFGLLSVRQDTELILLNYTFHNFIEHFLESAQKARGDIYKN